MKSELKDVVTYIDLQYVVSTFVTSEREVKNTIRLLLVIFSVSDMDLVALQNSIVTFTLFRSDKYIIYFHTSRIQEHRYLIPVH